MSSIVTWEVYMKLGNRKVVIGGLTAVAFTSLTAFTNVTPDTTSDTNPISATPSVIYQNIALAECGGISNFASLFMPGQVKTTLDAITTEATLGGSKIPVNAQAGIAKLFTQNITMDSLGTVAEDSTILSKEDLNNNNVGEVADVAGEKQEATDEADDTQEVTDAALEVTDDVQEATDDVQEATDTTQEATDSGFVSTDTVTDSEEKDENSESQQTVEADSDETTEDAKAKEAQTDTNQDQTDADTKTEDNEAQSQTKKAEDSEWSDKVMANVEESVNIRAEANEESEIVGKFYKGAEANILEKGEEWTKISSGSVEEGYVKNEYLAFGDDAEALAEQDGQLVATVNTDALRIRSEASEGASVLDLAENGEELTAVEEEGDWVEIQYTQDSKGFVSSQFVTVDYMLGKALTIEEEEAMKAEQKRKEAEARQAEIAASEDAALLAAVVRMEAGGESYEGKLAVASVVVNRMKSGGYPNTVSGVVYQSGQFPGASNGTLANLIANGVGGDCKKAAVEALSGLTNVDYMHFNSVSRIGANGYVIGNHCFY